MLKGTNRQVIEITPADCRYFEKVMFFVKPECANVSQGKLRERAKAMAGIDGKPPATKIRRNKLLLAGAMSVAAGIGAAITAALTAFFG